MDETRPSLSRAALRTRGQALADKIDAAAQAPADAIWHGMRMEFEAGLFHTRDVLPLRDRVVAWLTGQCVLSRHADLVRSVAAGHAAGLGGSEMAEIFLQCVLYAGFAPAEQALALTGLTLAPDPKGTPDHPGPAAMALRQELHGAAPSATETPLAALYEPTAEYGYGVLWARPFLSRRQRLICAIAATACMPGGAGTFRKFALAARHAGLSQDEVTETVIQVAPIVGFPTAFTACASLEVLFAAEA